MYKYTVVFSLPTRRKGGGKKEVHAFSNLDSRTATNMISFFAGTQLKAVITTTIPSSSYRTATSQLCQKTHSNQIKLLINLTSLPSNPISSMSYAYLFKYIIIGDTGAQLLVQIMK